MPQSATFAPNPPPAEPGTYILWMRLSHPTTITPGKLGAMKLPAGLLAYVGSAHGPGGLRARVGRHLRNDKRPHWHIDALTAAAPVVEVWWRVSGEKLECAWSGALAGLTGVNIPAPGFGASDCGCVSHLYHLAGSKLDKVRAALGNPRSLQSGAG